MPEATAPRRGRWILLILALGLVVQGITAIHQVGWWHPDSHFSIIEFAGHELGVTPPELMAREHGESVRQTVPVYVFMGFHEVMQAVGVRDVYLEQTLLRLATALLGLLVFNGIVLHALRRARASVQLAALLVTNLSWCMPYVRTLFCYETLGGILYFGGIWLYLVFRDRRITFLGGALVGFVLGFAFFFRFQMGFALVGLGLWLLFLDRPPLRVFLGLGVGFLVASGSNVWMDSRFYGELVFTPWLYYEINIIVGRAASIGTSTPLYYLGVLAVALMVPPLSVVLLGLAGWGMVKRWKDPYVLSTVFFLAAHFAVGHKEERFLFPVFGVLPLLMGYGLESVLARAPEGAGIRDLSRGWKWIVLPPIAINAAVLLGVMFVPVCQPVEFARRMQRHLEDGPPVRVVCLDRTPYETPTARNVMVWYRDALPDHVTLETEPDPQAFLALTKDPPPDTLFVCTFRQQVKADLWGELPCAAEVVGSAPLQWIARWIHRWTGSGIREVWGLYRCRPPRGG